MVYWFGKMVMVNGMSKRGLVGDRSLTNFIMILILKLNIWVSVELLTARAIDINELYFVHIPEGLEDEGAW